MSRLNNLYLFLNDEKGRSLPRAKLFFYENESFNFKATYADKALTAINPNPVIADGAGRFPNIFLGSGTYRVVLQDEDGVEISTKDDVDNLLSDGDNISNTQVTTSTGTQTTAAALDDRVVRVGSVSEMEALSPDVGITIYLSQEGRTGTFLVKTGTPPSDPQKGVYVVLANGNYAKRQFGQAVAIDGGTVSPLWFGANVDGTDDHTAVNAAVEFCNANRGAVDLGEYPYTLSLGLNLDIAKTKLKGSGARVTFTSTSATLLTLSSSEANVNKRGLEAAARSVSGIAFYGPGENVGTARFCYIEDTVSNSIWGATFENGGFYDFALGIVTGSGAFMINAFNFHGNSNGLALDINSGTNSGERNTFVGCTFANCDSILEQSNPNASTMFIGCSLDYSEKMVTATSGDVFISMSHIESNVDLNNWFSISGNNTSLRVSNSAIVLNNTAADLVSSPFNSDASVTMGGIFLTDCEIWTNATYTVDVLISGTGVSKTKGLTYFENSKKPAIARSSSDTAYGDFESANFANDFSSLTGTPAPVRSTAKAYTGTNSLQFEQGGGGPTCSAILKRPACAGEIMSGHFYYQTDVATATATFYCTVAYLDAAGAVIGSELIRLSQTANITAWTLFEFAPQSRAPAGTAEAQLKIQVFGASGATAQAWIDDLIVNVV